MKVNGLCADEGYFCKCCVVYKVTCKCCEDFYAFNTQHTLFKRMGKHFQDVPQKVIQNNNLDSFSAHFARHFTQKTSPKQCCEIVSLKIFYTVKPIG